TCAPPEERWGSVRRYVRDTERSYSAVGPSPRSNLRHTRVGGGRRYRDSASRTTSSLRPTTAVPSSAVMMGRWISLGCSASAVIHRSRAPASRGHSLSPSSLAALSWVRVMSHGSRPSRPSTSRLSSSLGTASRYRRTVSSAPSASSRPMALRHLEQAGLIQISMPPTVRLPRPGSPPVRRTPLFEFEPSPAPLVNLPWQGVNSLADLLI